MRIILIGLASAFTEGMTYQDNLLAQQLRAYGNEVTIVADCHEYQNGVLMTTAEEDRLLHNGIRLIRKQYRKALGEYVSGKVRAVEGLYEILETEKPDMIFHHGLQSYELWTVAKYKSNNPKVKLYVDSHATFHNSAGNVLSKYLLHKVFYKGIIQKVLPQIDRVFYVSHEAFEFLKTMYEVPIDVMEFFPLGGIVFEEKTRMEKRCRIREELGLDEGDILLTHTGKMNKSKRTEEIIEAFSRVSSDRLHLILIGSLNRDIEVNAKQLIASDKRITFIGWKSGNELLDYLCACDLYIQPGTQSATMQNAVCCGNAVALYPHPSHKALLEDRAFYVESRQDIESLLRYIVRNADALDRKRRELREIALDVLDYRVLATRLYC